MGLLWSDECAGAAGAPPDADLWGLRESDQWQSPGELQEYTRDPANAHYDGRGHLVITAVRASTRTAGGRLFTSARLSARHAARPGLFRNGRFEARIRVPTGRGIWPAWWLLGQDDRYGWPDCGEIDIMEAPSSVSTAGQIHQGTHSPHATDATAVGVGVEPSSGDWGAGFHTYAADWRPGRVDFFIDDRPTGAVTREDVQARGGAWRFDERLQSPILNLAVGGWAGPPQDWAEQRMLVEWVRIHDLV
jgi:beta-glucanase (GH16 family)